MGEMVRGADFSVYNIDWRYDYPQLFAYKLTNGEKSYTILTNLSRTKDFAVGLIEDYKSVVGHVNAMDYTKEFELKDKNLTLPMCSTLILEN
jgi:hypothetical protein